VFDPKVKPGIATKDRKERTDKCRAEINPQQDHKGRKDGIEKAKDQ
jgi:hypothetical protein